MSLSKSVCEYLKRNWLGIQVFLPLSQYLMIFAARSYEDLFSWHLNLGLGSNVGLGLLVPEVSFLNFYPPCLDVGPVCSMSLPLLSH